MDRNYNIPPPKLVDAIPGRLVWAKLGQWPNWPSRVVTLDDVPSNLRSALRKDFPRGQVLVQFFEDPPQYGSVPLTNLKAFHLFEDRFKHNKRVSRALALAYEYRATLPAHLASDGDVDREAIEAAEISRGEARKRERAEEFKEGAEEPGTLSEILNRQSRNDPVDLEKLRSLKQQLGKALRLLDITQVVGIIHLIMQQPIDTNAIRSLEFGAIGVHLSKHTTARIAEIGTLFLEFLKAQILQTSLRESSSLRGGVGSKKSTTIKRLK